MRTRTVWAPQAAWCSSGSSTCWQTLALTLMQDRAAQCLVSCLALPRFVLALASPGLGCMAGLASAQFITATACAARAMPSAWRCPGATTRRQSRRGRAIAAAAAAPAPPAQGRPAARPRSTAAAPAGAPQARPPAWQGTRSCHWIEIRMPVCYVKLKTSVISMGNMRKKP